MGFKYRINYKMISGEGLDMNCFGEILTASWRKDSLLQLWDYETLRLKNDIKWNFKEKEDVKASTQLYCCKFSNDFGKYIFAEGSKVNAVKVFDWNRRGLACIDQLSHAPVTLLMMLLKMSKCLLLVEMKVLLEFLNFHQLILIFKYLNFIYLF